MSDANQPMDKHDEDKPRVVESASATTSPDNQAGAAPVVITVVVLALLAALGCAVVGGVMKVAELAAAYDGSAYGTDPGEYGIDEDSLDELRDLLGGDTSDTELSSDNVFDVDLDCLYESVSDYVFSSDYSGSQNSVAEYVKAFAKVDDDATDQVVSHVRAAAAATDDETRADELSQAAEVCEQAKADIEAIELPARETVTGDRAEEILEDLEQARADTSERWEAFGQIIAIMASPSGHYESELETLDGKAGSVTLIAIDLSNALYTSSTYK